MIKLLLGAGVLALLSCSASLTHAAPPAPGQDPIEWCLLEGGEEVEQPDGSPIRACCAADGCFICDASWNNCHFEPTHGGRGAASALPDLSGPDGMAPGSQGRPGQLLPATPLLQVR